MLEFHMDLERIEISFIFAYHYLQLFSSIQFHIRLSLLHFIKLEKKGMEGGAQIL